MVLRLSMRSLRKTAVDRYQLILYLFYWRGSSYSYWIASCYLVLVPGRNLSWYPSIPGIPGIPVSQVSLSQWWSTNLDFFEISTFFEYIDLTTLRATFTGPESTLDLTLVVIRYFRKFQFWEIQYIFLLNFKCRYRSW
jgi:hypothetical protein